MNKVINNTDRDERIGSVFNHLFSVIFANEQIRDNDVPVWDFSTCVTETFVCPSILDNVSIGTSFAKTTVIANVCRAM